jgi:hypothetical protein
MNKSELIDQIALDAEISKAAAGRALDAAVAAVKQTLKKGERHLGWVRNVSCGQARCACGAQSAYRRNDQDQVGKNS